jgi:hypothetical protein
MSERGHPRIRSQLVFRSFCTLTVLNSSISSLTFAQTRSYSPTKPTCLVLSCIRKALIMAGPFGTPERTIFYLHSSWLFPSSSWHLLFLPLSYLRKWDAAVIADLVGFGNVKLPLLFANSSIKYNVKQKIPSSSQLFQSSLVMASQLWSL